MAGPDTNNTDPPYPIWGFGPPSPEPDTKKLDALLASLNGSAERFQTLWFSFLGLTLYLAIAALATTHRNLLLGEPQTLPILNIKVELLPFYVIAPLLYLVFHFYLLMMLALLARTAAEFDKQLRTTLPGKPEQERYRAQVGNALFLQLLVGMKGERTGVNALLMGLIALITIVLAPLATLVLMQMMFLPYHHLRITWWHRQVVVADLVLIVVMTYRCFFPRGVRKAPLVLGALSRKPRWATAMAFCVLLAVGLGPLVDWLSFGQGRWAGEPRPASFTEWTQWMRGAAPPAPEALLDYAVTANGVVFGLFPDRLKLDSETIVGGTKFEETKKEIASRGGGSIAFVPTLKLDDRDLQAADLRWADLRGVSLSEVAMQGANLYGADLEGGVLVGAQLQGANLDQAQLQRDNLGRAQLQGAHLSQAQLQGADLSQAQLQGADFSQAQLQGANLFLAQLQGASLDAQLQGANLTAAQLQGAYLWNAQLQGANLSGAQLQGARLFRAQLQGADLRAQLQGADLTEAQLQGADLSHANLADAEFGETYVFRTNMADANLATASIQNVDADQVKENDRGEITPFRPSDLDGWIASATEFAPEKTTKFQIGKMSKGDITAQFERLKPDFHESGGEPTWAGIEEAAVALDPIGANHRQRLAGLLGPLACAPEGAPYVARNLVGNPAVYDLSGRLASLGDQLDGVRALMKEGREKPEKCPGVAGFTEDDWKQLDATEPTEAAPANP